MPRRFRQRILDHLAHPKARPEPFEVLADQLSVPDEELHLFEQCLDLMIEEESLVVLRGCLALPAMPDQVEGRFKRHPRGFGFVRTATPFAEGDLYVAAEDTGGAMTGDVVQAEVRHGRRGDRSSGRVVEVVQRRRTRFTGTMIKHGSGWIAEPDGRDLGELVVVRDADAKHVSVGDKVVLEIVHFPEGPYHAEGVVVEVLGAAGEPDVETAAVIAAHGLHTTFDDAALDAAGNAARDFEATLPEERAAREDLTDRLIFTIDPDDSKDFDDAISIRWDPRAKEWELGIHIADVAFFVPPDSPLDQEARARGNSAYLPRLVLPMLPEVLSNGVCSLQPGVERMAKSVFVTLDSKGKVLRERFAATVIRSSKRFTYREAQAVIEGDLKSAEGFARTAAEYPEELLEALRMSDRLAKIIQTRRRRDGMIHLDLPDVDLVFADDGRVVDAVPEDDAFTHTLIEMFMVEANEAVGRLFAKLEVPVLRRTHPDPRWGDMQQLRIAARNAGMDIPEEPTRHDLQRLLDAVKGKPQSRAVSYAVLRTLTKATYAPAMVGHYALASRHYVHFTSPIRRFPDLTAHRALDAFLDRTDNGQDVPKKFGGLGRKVRADERCPKIDVLEDLGDHCSETEDNAEAAERSLREFLILQLLSEKFMGAELDASVAGVSTTAVAVAVQPFLVEGWIGLDNLPEPEGRPDRWSSDPALGRAWAPRSGWMLAVGDPVRVRVESVDLSSRTLTVSIVSTPRTGAPPKPKSDFGSNRPLGGKQYGKSTKRGERRRQSRRRR